MYPKVRNIKPNGLLFFAPPCASWIFLPFGLHQACNSSLLWMILDGLNDEKSKVFRNHHAQLLQSGWWWCDLCEAGQHFCTTHAICATCFNNNMPKKTIPHTSHNWSSNNLRLYYAHMRGVRFLVEQPMSSATWPKKTLNNKAGQYIL